MTQPKHDKTGTILHESRTLARLVLAEALAELQYEVKNGLNRTRVTRFVSFAVQADRILSLPIENGPAARVRSDLRTKPKPKVAPRRPCGCASRGMHRTACKLGGPSGGVS